MHAHNRDRGDQLVVVGGWDGVGTRRLASAEILSLSGMQGQGQVPTKVGGIKQPRAQAFVGSWIEFPPMLAPRYGGALIAL